MITGAHAILYSQRPERDREFLRDVLELPHIDVGEGWLIFALPPSEVAVHPSPKSHAHELYLLCEDIEDFVRTMKKRRVVCDPVKDVGWGLLTGLKLPGGARLGVYEPRHPRPKPVMKLRSRRAGAEARAPEPRRSRRPRGRSAPT